MEIAKLTPLSSRARVESRSSQDPNMALGGE
jgi:hypothetical protein